MKSLLTAFMALMLASCSEDPDRQDCPSNIVCTEEFRMITVKITKAEEPVTGLTAQTKDLQSGKVYQFENNAGTGMFDDGVYIVLTDAEMDEVKKEGTTFEFNATGPESNSEIMISETFEIGHDCCHIILVEGPTEIELQ